MDASSNSKYKKPSFRDAEGSFAGLNAATIASIIENASDVALVIEDGRIQDVAVSPDDLRQSGFTEGWIGKAWVDTVSIESRAKIAALLSESQTPGSSQPRQVNHPASGLRDVPVAYRTVRTSRDNRLIALGRDLRGAAELQQRLVRAQQELERDYALMRQAEARYKLVFEAVSEPILVVNSQNLVVEAANPAAADILQLSPAQIAGADFIALFDAPSARAAERLAAQAAATGKASAKKVTTASGRTCSLRANAFRQGGDLRLIGRLLDKSADAGGLQRDRSPLLLVLENLPDGFVVADDDLRIVTANQAFADMAHLSGPAEIAGARLGDFVGRSSTDLNVLVSTMRTNGTARNFVTVLRDRFGSEEDVEVSAVVTGQDDATLYGFSIRNVSRRLSVNPPIGEELPRSVEHLTNLVGRMPLKDIVRDSTALIERLCIEAALRLTDDNRASAAEILGLSRQGLYSKLNRFGFEDKE